MTKDKSTQKQIADRYIAKVAIFNAMVSGRYISFLDSAEFEVSEMHTQMCQIRKDIEKKNLPYELKSAWRSFGTHGKQCKYYWLQEK